MAEIGDLKKCKITIRDERNEKVLSETTILEHDKLHHTITVDGRFSDRNDSIRVSLAIDGSTAFITCKGIARKPTSSGLRDISIYQVKVTENRRAARYAVTAVAKVTAILMDNELVQLDLPLEVRTGDISQGGVMIETSDPMLEVGTEFWLTLDIAGVETVINTVIVRLVSQEGDRRQFGCQFLSIITA